MSYFDVLKQVDIWSNKFYNIKENINKDEIFKKWFKYTAPRVFTNNEFSPKKSYLNLSDITFSVEIDSEKENYSRFAIGLVADEKQKKLYKSDIVFFKEIVKKWVNYDFDEKNKIFFLGCGFNDLEKEKRIYWGFEKNNKNYMIGLIFDYNNNLLEHKNYEIISPEFVKAEGKMIRYQYNVLDNNLKDILNKIKEPLKSKVIKVLNKVNNEDFWIDTISLKKEKCVLYFS